MMDKILARKMWINTHTNPLTGEIILIEKEADMMLNSIRKYLPDDLWQLLKDRADTAGLTVKDIDNDDTMITIVVRTDDHIRDDVYVVDKVNGDWWLEE